MNHTRWVRSLHEDNSVLATLVSSGAVAGIKHTYDLPNLKGYSGRFSERIIEKIRESDEVFSLLLAFSFFLLLVFLSQ
jgi:cerevisin